MYVTPTVLLPVFFASFFGYATGNSSLLSLATAVTTPSNVLIVGTVVGILATRDRFVRCEDVQIHNECSHDSYVHKHGSVCRCFCSFNALRFRERLKRLWRDQYDLRRNIEFSEVSWMELCSELYECHSSLCALCRFSVPRLQLFGCSRWRSKKNSEQHLYRDNRFADCWMGRQRCRSFCYSEYPWLSFHPGSV